MSKKLYSDEERKERRKETQKRYREKNPNYMKQWTEEHPNYEKEWRGKNPQKYRANNILSSYNTEDKKHNRGKGDLTARWIIENIFSKPCVYCGKSGWNIIGCNRIDNSKPHTIDNVEPCCEKCNKKLLRK